MRILVISLVALSIALVATADKPEDYPPPPPVPEAAKVISTTTRKPIVTTLRRKVPPPTKVVKPLKSKLKPKKAVKKPLPLVKKRPNPPQPPKPKVVKPAVKQLVRQIVKQEAQRRDSSYGAPAAPPKRQVIIKQAGPSKQYGWVGHGRYAPLNIKNPFPSDLPKWIPMGNNIFEAGLLYPGKPGSAPAAETYSPPAPAPAPVKSEPSYTPPQPSYSQPQETYADPPEYEDSYSAPAPQPVYNPKPTTTQAPYIPPEIPAQPAYPAPVPSYGQSSLLQDTYEPVTAVPAYTTAQPAYQPAYTTAPPAYQTPTQPAYSFSAPASNKPFTVFNTPSQTSYGAQPVQQYAQPEPVQPSYPAVPSPGNYPDFNSLPGFAGQTYLEPSQPNYEAQASYDYPTVQNAFDVPLKVEETQPEDDVYFIFYEDKPEEEQLLKGYVSDVAPPAQESKFSPPKPESVRTVYVPYENAVNVPGVFDVSVGSSFGYSEPTARPVASNPSYDNPISSFDAPIYDENSYTAEASSYDANTFSEPLWRGNAGSLVRKARKPAVIDDVVRDATSVQFKTSLATSNLPFGSRLNSRTPYNIGL